VLPLFLAEGALLVRFDPAMATRTKLVFLMHPKEFKDQRTGTGRLTHLCLADSELHMGIASRSTTRYRP